MIATFNPIALIFASYGVGVLLTELVKALGYFEQFKDLDFLNDHTTRKLGVLRFKWFLKHTFMGQFNPKLKYQGKFDATTLTTLMEDMTYAEVNHLLGFVALQLFLFFLPLWGVAWWYVLLMTVLNIIFNLYLVFLQQFNKRRIVRVVEREANRNR